MRAQVMLSYGGNRMAGIGSNDECAFCIHRGLSRPVHLSTTNATSALRTHS